MWLHRRLPGPPHRRIRRRRRLPFEQFGLIGSVSCSQCRGRATEADLGAKQISRPELRLHAPCTAAVALVDVMSRPARVDAVRVVPGLWIGAAPDRRQAQALTRDGIDAVVDLRSEGSKTEERWPPGVEVVRVGLQDHGSPLWRSYDLQRRRPRTSCAAGARSWCIAMPASSGAPQSRVPPSSSRAGR